MLIAVLLLGSGGLLAQADLEKSVKNLRKSGCISKNTASILQDRVDQGSVDGPIELVEEALESELRTFLGNRYQADMIDGQGLTDAGLDTLVKQQSPGELKKMLTACEKSGLLDDRSRTALGKMVGKGKIRNPIRLLVALRKELLYREAVSPLKLQGLAQQLRANGLVSHAESGKLIRAIDDKVITDPFQMLDFCNNAARFDATEFSMDAEYFIKKLHEKTAELLPDLKIDKLEYTNLQGSDGRLGPNREIRHVSMEMNGFSYWQESGYDPSNENKESFKGRIDPASFYRIFNKALSEQGSLYRLHLVTCNLDDDMGMGPQRRFGIIALRESQPEAFRYLGSYYTFSKEDFRIALSRELVAGVIERYFTFGLFSHLTLQQYREMRSYALSNPRMSYEEVLDCFLDIFYKVPHGPFAKRSYEEQLKNLAAISRGQFTPANIREGDNFSFDFGGDTWAAPLQPYVDKPDPAFFELIDQAAATLPEGRFYKLPKKDKYIFLNTEQWDLLHRQKVVGKQK